MSGLFQPRLDDVADRDHAQQLAAAHHRHMAETAAGHGFHEVVDRVVWIAGDNLASHDMTRFEIHRASAVQRHGPHQVALGDDAGDLIATTHHQHRADAPCAELLGDLGHRRVRAHREYEAALLGKDIGDEHGSPLASDTYGENATSGQEKGCGPENPP